MKVKDFLGQIDEPRIVEAIRAAERGTSGEIRVFITRNSVANAVREGMKQFQAMEMHKTRRRNGVLLFLAPRSQIFAIIGDEAIHARCGDAFWSDLSETMAEALHAHHFTDAIILGVTRCGALLAEHFPPDGSDGPNELPDSIGRD